MLLQTAQRLPAEQSQPFFKLLSLLTDVGENGMPGLPSFIGMILPKLGEVIFLSVFPSLIMMPTAPKDI